MFQEFSDELIFIFPSHMKSPQLLQTLLISNILEIFKMNSSQLLQTLLISNVSRIFR